MSEMKHTPGPWEAVEFQGQNGVWIFPKGDLHELICTTDAANARLIAAAPEMVELLEDMASLSPKDQYDTYNHYFEQAKKLLSKIKNDSDATD